MVPAAAMTGKGADPAADIGLGAGRLVAASIEPPELVSSLALRLPADCFGMCGDRGTVGFTSLITFIWDGIFGLEGFLGFEPTVA